ncbi:MAG: hypothetical protein R3E08_12995 [Thiotrichaceae bacterium]
MAYREFSNWDKIYTSDGEKEFQCAVGRMSLQKRTKKWNAIEASANLCGYCSTAHLKMVFQQGGFDAEVVLKLEEDNLIYRDVSKSLVSPAHDVLEDWAIEKYIDEKYQEYSKYTNFECHRSRTCDESCISFMASSKAKRWQSG